MTAVSHAAPLSGTRLEAVSFDDPLDRRLRMAAPDNDVLIHWLGQAGFVISAAGRRIVIDPYLSDILAEKYRGSATPHDRLMPAPVDVTGLGPVDLVVVTHHHTDHMDPGTLIPLLERCPQARVVVPAASLDEALRRTGAAPDRLLPLDAGERIHPWPGLTVTAIRAAHEALDRDPEGRHRYLGYALTFELGGGSITVLHSGDTVPFPGQIEDAAALRPDAMLLPVNGRSAALQARGIAGNMTLDEALDFASAVPAKTLVAHHHGMFAFNTCRPEILAARAEGQAGLSPRLIIARTGLELRLCSD